MSDDVMIVDRVTKSYRHEKPLRDLSLRLQPGERLALLGHNGAGKTTLIHAVLGLTRIDSGRIRVFGEPPGTPGNRRAIGYLPESVQFHKVLTGREQLETFARLKAEPIGIVPDVMERVGLANAMDKRIGAYSKGMRQRLGLAQLLLGQPRLVVLDEPTSGLDPQSRDIFYTMIAELSASDTAVLMASHELTEIEGRTDRVALMRAGRLVADASISRLRQEAGLPIRLRVVPRPDQVEATARSLNGSRVNGHAVEITCDPATKMARLAEIAALKPAVDDVEVMLPSLEDVYRHFGGMEQEPEGDTP